MGYLTRMAKSERSIDATIGLLGTDEGVTHACEEVEAWAKAGHWEQLVRLSAALEERSDPEEPAPQRRRGWFEAVADHVEDQLALCTGDAAVDALLQLSLSVRKRSVTIPRPRSLRVRAFASRLG